MPPSSEPGFHHIRTQEATWDERDEHISRVIRGAVHEEMTKAIETHMPAASERAWVQLAMKREARREALHNAIIEKSLTGLVWAAVVGLGYMFMEWLKLHGWKGTP